MEKTRSSISPWRRLCRSLCREQGAKDAVMVALVAIVLGALAVQLGLGPGGPAGGNGRIPSSASLRARSGSPPAWPAPGPASASPGA